MTQKIINIHDAKLRTVSVGIKALTISDKQVTLAVFRQLFEEPLIDQGTGRLNGVPWGIVNYHPDGCKDHRPHWHIVWQHGEELRRDRIAKEARYEPWSTPTTDAIASAIVFLGLIGRNLKAYSNGPIDLSYSESIRFLDCKTAITCVGIVDDPVRDVVRHCRYFSDPHHTDTPERINALYDAYRQDLAKAERALLAELAWEATRRKQFEMTLRSLADLPQLFIAV